MAASVRRVAAPYGCGSMNFVRISRADNIRLYRALFRYSLCGRMISAPTYFERSELTPQSLRDSSPAGEPMPVDFVRAVANSVVGVGDLDDPLTRERHDRFCGKCK